MLLLDKKVNKAINADLKSVGLKDGQYIFKLVIATLDELKWLNSYLTEWMLGVIYQTTNSNVVLI